MFRFGRVLYRESGRGNLTGHISYLDIRTRKKISAGISPTDTKSTGQNSAGIKAREYKRGYKESGKR